MAKGSSVVVSADPRGRFEEGILGSGVTAYPGTVLQIDTSIALQGGKHTFVLYNADADGGRPKGPFFILREDHLQGRTMDDSYSAGERIFLYVPLPGDHLNLRIADADTGTTTNDVAIGTTLIVDDGTGTFIATAGSPETEVAQTLEAVDNMDGSEMAWCIWTGY